MTRIFVLLLLALISASAHAEWELILNDHGGSIASDGERLYVSTDKGMSYSRDDGDTWRLSTYKDWIGNLTAFPGAVYGYSYDHGIMRSVTKGNTWHPKNNGFDLVWGGRRFYYPEIKQFLVTASGMVIAVGYHSGTWISRDRGDRWHAVRDEWKVNDQRYTGFPLGDGIWSMGEFGDYLWALNSTSFAARSPDEGATWESIPDWRDKRSIAQFSRANAWISFKGDLYVGGGGGFGRWREEGLEWEDLSHGLPHDPALSSLVVHRDRIFAGSWRHGVFIFDHHAEMWHPAGLSLSIPTNSLVSHRGNLYAAAASRGHDGIYRAKRPFVSSEGKAAVTWGALKTK